MSTSTLLRLAGIAGVLSGLLLAIENILPEGRSADMVGFLSATLGLYVLTALYLGQRKASGVLGGIGYIVIFFGLVLITGTGFATAFVLSTFSASTVEEFMAGATGLPFMLSFVIYLIGVILFSIATIRAKVYPSVAAGLFLVGFLITFFAVLLSLANTFAILGNLVAGAGIVWFGYALWSGTLETA